MKRADITIRTMDNGTDLEMKQLGFHLVDTDKRIVPPIKPYYTESFADSAGETLYPKTTFEKFEYWVSFLCLGDKDSVTRKVTTFYANLFTTQQDSDIVTARRIKLTNYYTAVEMEGYVKDIDPDKFLTECSDEKEAYIFKLEIIVNNPTTLKAI